MVTQVPIYVGRDIFEGLPYNVAYSSAVGDMGLAVIVLVAAVILQRNARCIFQHAGFSFMPATVWPHRRKPHFLIFISSILLGVIVSFLTIHSRSGQVMDVYHDIVIAPLFLYLAVTLLPVIFMNGTKIEKRATICLILLWAGLVGFDIKYQRMNQRQWLQNHGVVLLKK